MANALFIRSVLDRRSCWGSCVEFIEALIHTGHGCFILMAGGPIGDESQIYIDIHTLPFYPLKRLLCIVLGKALNLANVLHCCSIGDKHWYMYV